MTKTLLLICAATFASTSMAYADDVIIRQVDPEPTHTVVIKEKQDPDIIVKKRKVVIREDNDPDVIIRDSVNID